MPRKTLVLFSLLLLTLFSLVSVASANTRHDQPEGATPLLPDLYTKQSGKPNDRLPYAGGIAYFFNKKKKIDRISFETKTANLGRGPFEIQADPLRRLDCDGNGDASDYGVRQVIYHDLDGNRIFNRLVDAWVDWRDSGCIYEHKIHSHWHFDDLNTSFLTNSQGQVVSRMQKNSWCLVDMEQAAVTLPWIADSGPFYGNNQISIYDNCSGPRVAQGLSPGWLDIYGVSTPGQVINVTNISSGNYCIVTVVDQNEVVLESNENNNRTGTPIRINKEKKKVTKRSGSC